jgi:hypothetical protein
MTLRGSKGDRRSARLASAIDQLEGRVEVSRREGDGDGRVGQRSGILALKRLDGPCMMESPLAVVVR